MNQYFPGPLGGGINVKVDLPNYATKVDFQNEAGVSTSKFAKKVDLGSLTPNVDKLDIDKLKNIPTNLSNFKSNVDNLDIDKLAPAPVDLSKLSNVANNDVVKKDIYMLRSKILKIKYLISLTQLLKLILMPKQMRLKEKYQVLLTQLL